MPSDPPAPAPAGPPPSLEVEATDVIKLILQFCGEHGLADTARTLQAESGVSLNAVPSLDALAADVRAGRWDVVLPAVRAWRLSPSTAASLHEQVVRELVELREAGAARAVLAGAPALQALATSDPARLAGLERLVAGVGVGGGGGTLSADPDTLWGASSSRSARRAALASALASEAVSPPPGRLLTLVSQALAAQFAADGAGGGGRTKDEGGGPAAAASTPAVFDLLTGALAPLPPSAEAPPGSLALAIRFGAGSHPEAAAWAPAGPAAAAAVLATGSVDGLVELWDGASGGPASAAGVRGAPPPADMAHRAPVLALAWSADAALLASGDRDGAVKVWNPVTGRCLRRLDGAHAGGGGVAALAFAPGGSHLVSGGYDGVARVHGLQSGRCLRELRGGGSGGSGPGGGAFVLAVACLPSDGGGGGGGGYTILTGGADGTVRAWDGRTGEAGAAFRPPPPTAVAGGGGGGGAAAAAPASPDQPIVAILPLPLTSPASPGGPAALVLPRGPAAHVMTPGGALVRTLSSGRPAGAPGSDFVAAALSPSGAWAHCLTEGGAVVSFDVATGAVAGTLPRAVEGAGGGREDCQPAAAAAGGAAAAAPRGTIPIGLAHHPSRNLVATYGTDGVLKLWVPA